MRVNQPNIILITGATGTIGAALARSYAAPGKVLILQGRNDQRLAELAATCTAEGARVFCRVLDLRDTQQLTGWLTEVAAQGLPDLLIANAGVNCNIGQQGQGESWQEIETLLDTNIKATFALVNQLLPHFRNRGTGQIALMSSLAAYFGLPITPSYCASKAALKTYGESLRGWLAAEEIKVSVIMPGYVDSSMCQQMPGPKPFLWTAEKAACVIKRGLEKDRARISFPFPLNFGCWILSLLPAAISQQILRFLKYNG